MKIPSFKVFVFFAILSVSGLLLMTMLSVQLNPEARGNSILISYGFANASAHVVEHQVTSVLEAGLNTVAGIKNISSKSSNGHGIITLELDNGISPENHRLEVATIIRQLYRKLPKNVSYPEISVNKSEDQERERPLMVYKVSGSVIPTAIKEFAYQKIVPLLNAVPGVDKVTVNGANSKEWIVKYDPEQLNAIGVSKDEIEAAVYNYYDRRDLGSLTNQEGELKVILKNQSKFFTSHLPVKNIKGSVIYLDELASVSYREQESANYFRVNGQNAVTISVSADKNVNMVKLADEIESLIKSQINSLPETYKIRQAYNASDYLSEQFDKVIERSVIAIVLLLLLVLLMSFSFRYLIINVISIVMNITIAFALYYFFKVEIHLYSLAGIIVSLGLIVNNTVMVLSYEGKQPEKNLIPFLASLLASIAAFQSVCFLDEKMKIYIADFALVLCLNLAVSFFIALILLPVLSSKLLPKKRMSESRGVWFKLQTNYELLLKSLLKYKKVVVVFVVLTFGIPFFMLPKRLEQNQEWYQKAYNSTLGHDWVVQNIRPFSDVALGGTFRLFSVYVNENSGYRTNEETKLYVMAEMEKGATVHQLNEALLGMENYLSNFSEIKEFTTQVEGPDFGFIEIVFNPGIEKSSFPLSLKSKLIRKVISVGGIEWQIYGIGNGFRNGGTSDPINFSVKATGYNLDELNLWAEKLKAVLEGHPRIQNVGIRDNSRYSSKKAYGYRLSLNKDLLTLQQSTASEVYKNLKERTFSKGNDFYVEIDGKYEPVRFESKNVSDFDLWKLKNTLLPASEKMNAINLKENAHVEKEVEQENIDKENQEYIKRIEFQYMGSSKNGTAFLEEKIKEMNNVMPLGYKMEMGNNYGILSENAKINCFYVLLFIFVTQFFICSILFENLKQSLIVLSVIPLSFIGVFVSFYFFEFHFDQGGFTSFILLSGLNLSASIFVINDFNGYKKSGLASLEAFVKAYFGKIKVVFITVVSSALGFLPFLIQGEEVPFWSALAIGSIGGLLFSLLAITFFLPIFCIKKQKTTTNT
ncbi:MAG TPA: efflux RND transporter permease subunit [Flavobacterium sp.]|uniref:efflux RND transporter permease subunit n=1 Tax=Flavobacterium sp. TaxID=239 RepID=UPI002CF4ED54|nr:efflux RND transporter permease subunit [Flavobacterium sp.]HSD15096.1 efflux RND transporter permease subunit [Flavobacterium sp.]